VTVCVCDTTGLHIIDVCFCQCNTLNIGMTYCWQQLLCVGWFPASTDQPQTMFTTCILKLFHQLMLQGKMNLYDFSQTL
ncbi:uncharacterized protein LAESUDRAFT_652011, partial [Laetiporus sulphureus 93-53]